MTQLTAATHAASTRRRQAELLVLLGGISAMAASSTDMYVPALPALAADLDVTKAAAQLTLTTFFVGLALGQVAAGSVSDILGRRRPLFVGIGFFILASLACVVAQSLPQLVVARFCQGFAAASGMAISRAIVRDLYSGADAARMFSRMFLVIGMAPMIAPIVGSQILRFSSWRGIFVLTFAFGVILAVAAITRLPETLPPERRRPGSFRSTAGTLHGLLTTPIFLGYAFSVACSVAIFSACIADGAFVVQDVYGHSAQVFGLMFFSVALVLVVNSQLNARLVRTVDLRKILLFGLSVQLLGGVAVLTIGRDGLWAFFVCLALLIPWWGFVSANGTALAMRDHPAVAGSAAALVGLAQFGFGALAAPLAGLTGNGSITALGIVIATFAALAVVTCALTVAADRRRPLARG